jgi:murein DD-endopeptidase MepM/ murein hydrolase activator NlpD
VGETVEVGQPIGLCGNSGNSTQPHVHLQATDSRDWSTARGLPIAFKRPGRQGDHWLPKNEECFEA